MRLHVVAVALLVAVECSPSGGQLTSPSTAPTCNATAPTASSDPTRIRLGPLWIAGLSSSDPPTVLWKRGYPTKLLLQEAEPITTVIELTGWACSDGKQLRFWYHDGLPFTKVPASDEAMASTGDLKAKVDFVSQPNSKTGYMLFTHSGRWMVQLTTSQRDHSTVGIAAADQS
jgi:hypothetical protein